MCKTFNEAIMTRLTFKKQIWSLNTSGDETLITFILHYYK